MASIHEKLYAVLTRSVLVGATHVGQQNSRPSKIKGVKPAFFFAPSEVRNSAQRHGGSQRMNERVAKVWQAFIAESKNWMSIIESVGIEATQSIFRKNIEGTVSPSEGHIMCLVQGPLHAARPPSKL